MTLLVAGKLMYKYVHLSYLNSVYMYIDLLASRYMYAYVNNNYLSVYYISVFIWVNVAGLVSVIHPYIYLYIYTYIHTLPTSGIKLYMSVQYLSIIARQS